MKPLHELVGTEPIVERYGKQLAKIKDRLAKAEARKAEIDKRRINRLQTMLDRFRNKKGKNGRRLYPKFKKLKTLMGGLMELHPDLQEMPDGQAKLRRAYEMAKLIT